MRLAPETLTFRALVALDEVLDGGPATQALRFALAYLYAVGNADRHWFDEFWRRCFRDEFVPYALRATAQGLERISSLFADLGSNPWASTIYRQFPSGGLDPMWGCRLETSPPYWKRLADPLRNFHAFFG